MWVGTALSLSAGSFAAALPSWRSVVGGLLRGLAAGIEKRRADGGEGSFHACKVLFARNRVFGRANDCCTRDQVSRSDELVSCRDAFWHPLPTPAASPRVAVWIPLAPALVRRHHREAPRHTDLVHEGSRLRAHVATQT